MGERFPGGVISKTPPTVTGPTDGEGGSASGLWSLDEVLGYEKAGAWPKGVLPRELYAWGENAQGQLGDGTVDRRSSPVQIGSTTDWERVSCLNYGSLAVKTTGSLWAWGRGDSGELGTGDTVRRSSPVQIGALTNWYLTEGGRFSTAAVKTDGTLWTWGSNTYGQLGTGNVTSTSSPVQVGLLTDWAQVSAGDAHCAAVKTDGTLWTWGSNVFGQLGNNAASAVGNEDRSSPVQIGALTTWSQPSAGRYHTGAVKTDGTLWMWGGNGDGELGIGIAAESERRSSPVQVGALTNWQQVAAGRYFTVAIKTTNSAWAWGRNSQGQLGDGTVSYRSSPVQIGALTNWSFADAGRLSVFLKTDGTLWTVGKNAEGQIGDNTVIFRSSPVQVGSLTNWEKVAVTDHVLATTKG